MFARQSDAVQSATRTAKRQRSELIIQGEEGQIREKNSYGHDPNPPKG